MKTKIISVWDINVGGNFYYVAASNPLKALHVLLDYYDDIDEDDIRDISTNQSVYEIISEVN